MSLGDVKCYVFQTSLIPNPYEDVNTTFKGSATTARYVHICVSRGLIVIIVERFVLKSVPVLN